MLLPSGVFFVALFASRQHHYMELCHYLSPALGVEHACSGGDDSWCGVLDKEKETPVCVCECVSLVSHTLHIERKGLAGHTATTELSPRNAIIEHSDQVRC